MSTRTLTAALLMLIAASAAAAQPANPASPTRLASTDAAVTEILVGLGETDRLVAVDASSTLPADLDVPRLGYHRALAAEGLIALNPDLVIGSEHMGPPHVVASLERAGIDVLRLPSPDGVATLRANIQRIAEVLGSDAGAPLLAQLDQAAVRLAALALDGHTAAFLLRGEGGKLRLAGQGTGGHGFTTLLGATNIAEHAGYRSITAEALLQLAPDVLLVADTQQRSAADLLEAYPLLRFSPAVRNQLLLTVDSGALVAGVSLSALTEAGRVLQLARARVASR